MRGKNSILYTWSSFPLLLFGCCRMHQKVTGILALAPQSRNAPLPFNASVARCAFSPPPLQFFFFSGCTFCRHLPSRPLFGASHAGGVSPLSVPENVHPMPLVGAHSSTLHCTSPVLGERGTRQGQEIGLQIRRGAAKRRK